MMEKVEFELGLPGWESAKLTTRPWEYYLYLMQKSLDLYLVNLDVALLVRAISMSFLNSLCEEVSESMVSSSGIQFFTRLDSGEQCPQTRWPQIYAYLVCMYKL